MKSDNPETDQTRVPPTLLITRPEADARRLLAELSETGVHPKAIIAPVMDISPVTYDLPSGEFDLLILSSRHAVAAALPYVALPLVCVGEATARAARTAGFEVRAIFPDADALVEGLAAQTGQRVLHLHGQHARGQIAERLNSAELFAVETVVYAQKACHWPPRETRDIRAEAELIAPLYSPRSARLLAENLGDFSGRLTLIGLSQACLDAWNGVLPVAQQVCEVPDGAAMKQAIASQFR